MERPIRILLIDPTDQWVTNNHVLKHREQVMLPIGLMYLSSYAKREHGAAVDIRIVSTIVDIPSLTSIDSASCFS